MMDSEAIPDKNAAQLIDILEQIKRLNELGMLHRQASGASFMVEQYEDLKNRAFAELKDLLSRYQIKAELQDLAA